MADNPKRLDELMTSCNIVESSLVDKPPKSAAAAIEVSSEGDSVIHGAEKTTDAKHESQFSCECKTCPDCFRNMKNKFNDCMAKLKVMNDRIKHQHMKQSVIEDKQLVIEYEQFVNKFLNLKTYLEQAKVRIANLECRHKKYKEEHEKMLMKIKKIKFGCKT